MILSFHPLYEADTNIICAGRQPDESDRAAMARADAVILPQGCRQPLYEMARAHCENVFPEYDARFAYPGKIGQTRLFQRLEVGHPKTWTYSDLAAYRRRPASAAGDYPLVLKLDWGGEGETVYLLRSAEEEERALAAAAAYEKSGQHGFVVQRYVDHGRRSLRVVVVVDRLESYWRVQTGEEFGTSVAKGAIIDRHSDPDLQRQAMAQVQTFCGQTGINLAGFDLIFDAASEEPEPIPLFLEINYFFGRTGIGGSERYYALLQSAIDRWLKRLGLAAPRPAPCKEKP